MSRERKGGELPCLSIYLGGRQENIGDESERASEGLSLPSCRLHKTSSFALVGCNCGANNVLQDMTNVSQAHWHFPDRHYSEKKRKEREKITQKYSAYYSYIMLLFHFSHAVQITWAPSLLFANTIKGTNE